MISTRRRAPSDFSDDYDQDDITIDLDADRRPRRSFSDAEVETVGDDDEDDDEDPRMSVLGPKLTLVSRAPWEPGDGMLAEEDELDDGGSMLETLSLFGGKGGARGRKLASKDKDASAPSSPATVDWRRPFAQTQVASSRSSSSTRPSREYRAPAPNTLYSNLAAARSAASISVYSVASAKDLTANAPPLPSPVGTTPPNSARPRPPKVRARTTSAGTRSSVFSVSAASSHSASRGSDVPPMPRVPFVDSPSAAQIAFPEREPESPSSLHPYAHPDLASERDDSSTGRVSMSASASSTRSPARSGASKPPLSVSSISTPLPAPQGAPHSIPGWNSGAPPSSPSWNLISLEQAQQQKARERTRSVTSPAVGASPTGFPSRSATADVYPPPESHNDGPPPGKTVKTRRSGFLKLFKGADKEPPPPTPAVPPIPAVPSRPIPPPPSQHQQSRQRAMTGDSMPSSTSPTRRTPPSLSVVITPSPQPARQMRGVHLEDGSAPAYLGGNLDPMSRPEMHAPAPPKSAPPMVTSFDGSPALQLRPVSTLFSHLPETMFTPQSQSPQSSPELVAGWQHQIAELESQVRELRAQLAELRSGAPCEHCGRGIHDSDATASEVSASVSVEAERTPPVSSSGDWRAAGVSVVDRPRARTAGRDRTTFAGMWRD